MIIIIIIIIIVIVIIIIHDAVGRVVNWELRSGKWYKHFQGMSKKMTKIQTDREIHHRRPDIAITNKKTK